MQCIDDVNMDMHRRSSSDLEIMTGTSLLASKVLQYGAQIILELDLCPATREERSKGTGYRSRGLLASYY